MKSVGEVMAIGRTFQQAFAQGDALARARRRTRRHGDDEELLERLESPGADRFDVLLELLRRGVRTERGPRAHRRSTPGSCASCASWRCDPEAPFAGRPHLQGGRHLRRRVRGRDAVLLLGLGARRRADEVRRGDKPSVMILGSGPNRIGQGIEFDYCCVHAAMTVRESGRDAVMVNCNPETVSTDYDTSDRLYFEPLTLEDVLGDRRGRAARGRDRPVRRPDAAAARGRAGGGRRAAARHPAGGDRPGRGPRALRRAARAARAARRRRTRPRTRREEALAVAPRVGFPLLVRPSYVLGGRAMEIVYSTSTGSSDYLRASRAAATGADLPRPLPRERDRGRRRRDLRRRGRLDRRRSCSTSRRPASTPATRPACCRRTRSAREMLERDPPSRRAARARARRASG